MFNVGAAISSLITSLKRENGQALAEYGLILALVAVALVGILGLLALGLIGGFQDVIDALP